MKSLQETLSGNRIQEGIFNKKNALDQDIIKDWVETWISADAEIRNTFEVYVESRPGDNGLRITPGLGGQPKTFDGFPAGIKFFDAKTNKPMDVIRIIGSNITSIKNIPVTDNSVIGIHCEKGSALDQSIIDELAKHPKYKELSLSSEAGKSDVDFTKLSGNIKTFEIFAVEQDIEFNKSLTVDTMSFGFAMDKSRILNLPEVKKSISFSGRDVAKIKDMIKDCAGNDSINWGKVIIAGRSLSPIDKENIKNMLSQESEKNSSLIDPYKIYDTLKDLMSKPNNDTDSSKDAFGYDLHPGDIVVYAGSNGQAMFDVFVTSAGSRIKTVMWAQAKPHQIINLSNPELLNVVKLVGGLRKYDK